jgi:hypothetical protein
LNYSSAPPSLAGGRMKAASTVRDAKDDRGGVSRAPGGRFAPAAEEGAGLRLRAGRRAAHAIRLDSFQDEIRPPQSRAGRLRLTHSFQWSSAPSGAKSPSPIDLAAPLELSSSRQTYSG